MADNSIYYFIYFIAFAASASAFSFNSIFWLRVLSAISSLGYVLYYFLFPAEPLWLDIITEGALIIINVVMLFALQFKKSKVKFTPEEKEIYRAYFSEMSAFEFFKIIRLAKWRMKKKGDLLIAKNQPVEWLYFLYNGTVRVILDQDREINLRDGAFVGELSFSLSRTASADVQCVSPSHIVAWNQHDLRKLLKRNPTMKSHFNRIITEDLANKLR